MFSKTRDIVALKKEKDQSQLRGPFSSALGLDLNYIGNGAPADQLAPITVVVCPIFSSFLHINRQIDDHC